MLDLNNASLRRKWTEQTSNKNSELGIDQDNDKIPNDHGADKPNQKKQTRKPTQHMEGGINPRLLSKYELLF